MVKFVRHKSKKIRSCIEGRVYGCETFFEAVGALLAAGVSTAAHAGSHDTLNIAIDRELESIDNYYNTAREGIVISRMVGMNCCIAIQKPTSTCQTSLQLTSGWTRKRSV